MKNHICQGSLIIYCSIVLLFSFISDTYAQFDSLGLNTKWRSGSIVLTNNSSLKGQLRFNDKMGIVKFKKSPGDTEQSFSERSIIAMQFYDEDAARWRNFATFNVNEDKTGWQGAILFEVLMEFKNFALLSRVERVNIGVRQREDSFGNSTLVKVGYEQFEKFCIADDGGTVTVVLAVSEFEKDKLSLASKLKPYLNKKALEKQLAGDWDKFESLVKNNKLNLKKRADFIRAFENYQVAIK
jgi:hypothetical protein